MNDTIQARLLFAECDGLYTCEIGYKGQYREGVASTQHEAIAIAATKLLTVYRESLVTSEAREAAAKLAEMEALVVKRSTQAREEKAKREAVEAERDRLKEALQEAVDYIDSADAPSIGGTPMTSHVASAYVALATIIDNGRAALAGGEE